MYLLFWYFKAAKQQIAKSIEGREIRGRPLIIINDSYGSFSGFFGLFHQCIEVGLA